MLSEQHQEHIGRVLRVDLDVAEDVDDVKVTGTTATLQCKAEIKLPGADAELVKKDALTSALTQCVKLVLDRDFHPTSRSDLRKDRICIQSSEQFKERIISLSKACEQLSTAESQFCDALNDCCRSTTGADGFDVLSVLVADKARFVALLGAKNRFDVIYVLVALMDKIWTREGATLAKFNSVKPRM